MTKLARYRYGLLLLLLLNVLWMGLWWQAVSYKQRPPLHEAVQAQLQLSDAQYQQFLASAEYHHQSMERLNAQEQAHLQEYFHHLTQVPDSTRGALMVQIQQVQREKIERTYQHFAEIQAFLKPEQYDEFEVFMRHVLKNVIWSNKKSPAPPKEKY